MYGTEASSHPIRTDFSYFFRTAGGIAYELNNSYERPPYFIGHIEVEKGGKTSVVLIMTALKADGSKADIVKFLKGESQLEFLAASDLMYDPSPFVQLLQRAAERELVASDERLLRKPVATDRNY